MSIKRETILSRLEPSQETGEQIDILEMALMLASLDLPQIELEPYRRHLDNVSFDLRIAAKEENHIHGMIAAIKDVLFRLHGYSGDTVSFNDMQNANIMRVIDRRKGLPIALGILIIHIARAQEWEIKGVNFPGYFLLRITHEGEQVLIDPFDQAKRLTNDNLNRLIHLMHGPSGKLQPSYLQTASDRDILLRLQNNIKIRALEAVDSQRALEVIESMHHIAPYNAGLISEMAILEAENGNLKRALSCLSNFNLRWKSHPQKEHIIGLHANLKRRFN